MVDYFTIPELPDRQMFRCERLAATIAVEACSNMWKQANDKGAPERLDLCRNCQLGAKHAGVGEISLSPLRGASICARCHRGTTRLIKGHLCVSCQNREYEYLKGCNAKGKPPQKHPPLYPVSMRVLAGKRLQTIRLPHAVGTLELVVAALRDCSKQVSFSFTSPRLALPQGDLFR